MYLCICLISSLYISFFRSIKIDIYGNCRHRCFINNMSSKLNGYVIFFLKMAADSTDIFVSILERPILGSRCGVINNLPYIGIMSDVLRLFVLFSICQERFCLPVFVIVEYRIESSRK